MTTLIVGASGATGRLLAQQLVERGELVRLVVRSPERVPVALRQHGNVSVIQASIAAVDALEMASWVSGCDAIASCLGHNVSMKGIWGPPYRLVTNSVRRLCSAVEATRPDVPVKFVLMNTAGNCVGTEKISLGQKIVLGLIRLLVPPHADNEQAAKALRSWGERHPNKIEWVAVRPDDLVDSDEVSDYEVYASPIRSAIFNAGKTSRINVGHFMAELITELDLWEKWKGKLPVIYNES